MLDRKAVFNYKAKYEKKGEKLLINKLRISRRHPVTAKVYLNIVETKDLPRKRIKTYGELIMFLAEKAIRPVDFQNARGVKNYTIFAVSEEHAAHDSELTIAISAYKSGLGGYKKASKSFLLNGWPVAIASGKFDAANNMNKLYAKVLFTPKESSTQLLGSYKLSAFKK